MSNRAKTLLLFIVDILILFLSLSVVLYARKFGSLKIETLINHYSTFIFIFPLWILMYFIEGIYSLRTYNPLYLPVSLIRATTISTVLSITIFYFLPDKITVLTPKTVLLFTGLLTLPLLFLWRRQFYKFFSKSNFQRSTILIGNPETISIVEHEIKRKPYMGFQITKSYVPNESDIEIPSDIQFVAIERKLPRNSDIYKKAFSFLGTGVQIIDLAKFAEQISGKIPISSIDESWFIEYCGQNSSRTHRVLKSMLDKSVALALLFLLIPVAIFLLPILLIVHGRPIFFKQTRTGLNNKPFTLYKLRSMVVDAEKDGAQWAKPKDARITPLGKILRKTRLDELPQLYNILKGEMSLVGPRPERPEIIESKLAPTIPYYNLRHLVKPGVTGWAQVTFRYGFSTEDSKEKLQYDLFYVKNKSIWLDILVIVKTIKTVLTGAGQ